jgi:hypothetical protein
VDSRRDAQAAGIRTARAAVASHAARTDTNLVCGCCRPRPAVGPTRPVLAGSRDASCSERRAAWLVRFPDGMCRG